jgi:predicted membrane protein
MARYLLPWSFLSFVVVVLSGFLMFAVNATQIAANPAFRLKLLLLCAAGVNAAFFHRVAFKSVKFWNRGVRTPRVVRAIAAISLVLWTGVIICGRLIAYV